MTLPAVEGRVSSRDSFPQRRQICPCGLDLICRACQLDALARQGQRVRNVLASACHLLPQPSLILPHALAQLIEGSPQTQFVVELDRRSGAELLVEVAGTGPEGIERPVAGEGLLRCAQRLDLGPEARGDLICQPLPL